jgi:hypothetical protein
MQTVKNNVLVLFKNLLINQGNSHGRSNAVKNSIKRCGKYAANALV